jgi:hypothetical protein
MAPKPSHSPAAPSRALTLEEAGDSAPAKRTRASRAKSKSYRVNAEMTVAEISDAEIQMFGSLFGDLVDALLADDKEAK